MPKAPKEPAKTTSYVVLTLKGNADGSTGWNVLGQYGAVTALGAIRAAVADTVTKPDDLGERFVAVPARSWKPVQRTVEQVTKERWS